MTVSARIDPIDRDIAAIFAADLSPAAQSRAFADMARDALADADAQNNAALGWTPGHDSVVDGAPATDAGLDRVKPGGTIVFRFRLVTDVLEYIDALLITNSPVRSGRYARSHLLFADGVETNPLKPAQAQVYTFLNAQPYSRKVERLHAVYNSVAVLAASRFGNIARVRFGFGSLPSAAVGKWAAETRLRPRRGTMRGAKLRDWLTRQPAVIVTV